MGGGLTAVCAAQHRRWKQRLVGLQHQAAAFFSRSRGMRLSEQLSSQDLGYTGGTLWEEAVDTPAQGEKTAPLVLGCGDVDGRGWQDAAGDH